MKLHFGSTEHSRLNDDEKILRGQAYYLCSPLLQNLTAKLVYYIYLYPYFLFTFILLSIL